LVFDVGGVDPEEAAEAAQGGYHGVLAEVGESFCPGGKEAVEGVVGSEEGRVKGIGGCGHLG
jgi:hypothetical protein